MDFINKNKSGFTLVELMIVLVIIAIVATVSTMSSLAVRVKANEGNAQAALKTISSGSEMYLNTHGSYPADLTTLGADYISSDLVSGQKNGYVFELKTANQSATYTVTTVPLSLNYTGVKSYCINNFSVIYVYLNAPTLTADGTSCPAGGTALTG